jgi:ABC-type polysaccharide transport system permease subunit
MSSEVVPTTVQGQITTGEHAPWRRERRVNLTPYLFVSPALICLIAFGVLPIVVAAAVSLTNLDISGLGHYANIHYVGLGNYRKLFGDSVFWESLRNTAFFVVIGVPTIVVSSLTVAIALNQSKSRLFRALRVFYFFPAITAIVAISLIWGYLYNSQFGLFNYLLSVVGVAPVQWLSDPLVAKFSVALVAIWRASGLDIVIFLAALQAIPAEYYEAASIDGAKDLQHHDPAPQVRDLLRNGHDAHQLDAVLRRAVRAHAGRSRPFDDVRLALHLPTGIQLQPVRLRVGGFDRAVRDHRRRDRRATARANGSGGRGWLGRSHGVRSSRSASRSPRERC